jgi:hypothetical protein
MEPAGRQTFPDVAFHSRMRPSFPADESTVLHELDQAMQIRRLNNKSAPSDIPLYPSYGRPARQISSSKNDLKIKKALVLFKVGDDARGPPPVLALARHVVVGLVGRSDPPDANVAVAATRRYEVV